MYDGPAIATLIFIVAIFAIHRVIAALGRRALRADTARLFEHCLVRWKYSSAEWRGYCEQLRRDLWFGTLRPALRHSVPIAVLAAGLALVIELRAGMARGLPTVLVLCAMILVGNVIIGPHLRAFVGLTRRRDLDYELLIGETGALEIWRDAGRVRATEEHPFAAGGTRIERAEASGVDSAEIVITLARPLAFGFLHTEERFLVPSGRLAEAREIAQQLAPPASNDENPAA